MRARVFLRERARARARLAIEAAGGDIAMRGWKRLAVLSSFVGNGSARVPIALVVLGGGGCQMKHL